jgi:Sigma-70, region 4
MEGITRRELRTVLDEELNRLPEKYRTSLVLCYLQGKSHAQAAQELGRPLGSMSRHVTKARELLCQRLTRRGVMFPAGLLGTVLAHEKAAAALSVTSVQPAVQGSMGFAVGQTRSALLRS